MWNKELKERVKQLEKYTDVLCKRIQNLCNHEDLEYIKTDVDIGFCSVNIKTLYHKVCKTCGKSEKINRYLYETGSIVCEKIKQKKELIEARAIIEKYEQQEKENKDNA